MPETMAVVEELAALVEAGFTPDQGCLETIFVRPEHDAREELEEATLTAAEGVVGDLWKTTDPRTQITLMNAQVLDCVCEGDRSRWGLAGDQLIVDLDLSVENLPVGQRLKIGGVTVEVTEVPHTGCKKFTARYGTEALDYINAEERADLRLRGLYVMVIEEGVVRAGDVIEKI
jgi:hypothetical protein